MKRVSKDWPREFPGVHWYDRKEQQAVLDVLRARTVFRYYGLRKPRHVAAFEAQARKFYAVKHALGVSGGTGALMTAMTALGIGPGDEVIVPSFFWVSTVGAVVAANAIPVLCEIDDSFCMDPADLERKITPRTRLILPVHMAGAPCDMRRIMAVARRHKLAVLEDCAQCNGGSFRGRMVGTFGQVGMFSLQVNKNITAGEGGLLVTDDRDTYYRLQAAHDIGALWVKEPSIRPERYVTWGSGRRMSELCGAVAAVQLRKLPRIVRHMRDSKRRIKAMLEGTPGLTFRRLNDPEGDTACFLIFSLPEQAAAVRAAGRMGEAHLPCVARLADYGMHVYHNIPQLVNKVPLSPAGNPWNLKENAESVYDYRKGACSVSDDLFARSVLTAVPSRLTRRQEKELAGIIRSAVSG